MDKNNKLAEKLLKADGIDPAATSESERLSFAKILNRQLSPNIWRLVLKSQVAKFTSAAVIIIVLSFWFVLNDSCGHKQEIITVNSKKTAELMTLSSLRTAMSSGGIEAVENQISEACILLGPRPNNSSAQDL
ncbi:MAG: hypothetical protein ABFD79_02605 [Phycisphaerales bacterium]